MAARRQAGSQNSTLLQRLRRPQASTRTRSVGDENDTVTNGRIGSRRNTYAFLNITSTPNSGNSDAVGVANLPLNKFESINNNSINSNNSNNNFYCNENREVANGNNHNINSSCKDVRYGFIIYSSTWTHLCHTLQPAYPTLCGDMPRPKFLSYQDLSVGDWQNFESEIERLRSSMRRTIKLFAMIPNLMFFAVSLIALETTKTTIITSEMATTFAVLLMIFVMFAFVVVTDSFISQYVHHRYFHPELRRLVGQFQTRLSQHRACSPYVVSYHVVIGKNETDSSSASAAEEGSAAASASTATSSLVRVSSRKVILPVTSSRTRPSTSQSETQQNEYMKSWWSGFVQNPIATLAAPHWSYIEFQKTQQTAIVQAISTLVV